MSNYRDTLVTDENITVLRITLAEKAREQIEYCETNQQIDYLTETLSENINTVAHKLQLLKDYQDQINLIKDERRHVIITRGTKRVVYLQRDDADTSRWKAEDRGVKYKINILEYPNWPAGYNDHKDYDNISRCVTRTIETITIPGSDHHLAINTACKMAQDHKIKIILRGFGKTPPKSIPKEMIIENEVGYITLY